MTDRNTLHQLLFYVLVELRYEGYEAQNTKVIKLADLFHNLPLWMKEIDNGTVTADELLSRLRERAHELGIERWLDHRLAENDRTRQAAAG